jgi:hypothetical protein
MLGARQPLFRSSGLFGGSPLGGPARGQLRNNIQLSRVVASTACSCINYRHASRSLDNVPNRFRIAYLFASEENSYIYLRFLLGSISRMHAPTPFRTISRFPAKSQPKP